MNSIFTKIRDKHALWYKGIVFVFCIIACTYLLPKHIFTPIKNVQVGDTWLNDNLISSFDFLIKKSNEELTTEKKEARPYKILTAGKQVTIKSTKAINHVMLWTTGGNRVIEQKKINSNSYTFTIPVNQKTFFLMIGLEGGKIYTEKIGIRE